MSHHKPEHPHHHEHSSKPPMAWWKQPHKDWRVVAAVILMLIGMLIYVLTLDESLPPAGKLQPPIPAAP